MQTGDLLVQLLRQTDDPLDAPLPEQHLREALVCEAAGHHEAGMPRRTPEVHEATFGQEIDGMAVLESESVDLRLDRGALYARP